MYEKSMDLRDVKSLIPFKMFVHFVNVAKISSEPPLVLLSVHLTNIMAKRKCYQWEFRTFHRSLRTARSLVSALSSLQTGLLLILPEIFRHSEYNYVHSQRSHCKARKSCPDCKPNFEDKPQVLMLFNESHTLQVYHWIFIEKKPTQ